MKWLAIVLSYFVLSGCGAFLSNALPGIQKVLVAVQDAQMILDTIEAAAGPLIENMGDKRQAMEFDMAMSKARRALMIALRTTEGAESLSKEEYRAAFAEFREAYAELEALSKDIGVFGADGALMAAPGRPRLSIVKPLAVE